MMALDLPSGPVQLVGHTVGHVTEGLTGRSPWMLGLLLLNCVGIAAAVYFLNILIRGQQGHLAQVLEVQQTEVRQILDMHNREFDTLMKMVGETLDRLDKPPPAPPPQEDDRLPLPRP